MSKIDIFFNDSFRRLSPISIINCRNVLNLSHNEIHHPEYLQLFSEFIQEYPVALISRYPFFEQAHELASENHQVGSDQLMLVPGSDFAINLLMNAIGTNSKGLITHTPNYSGYIHYARLQNLRVQEMRVITSDFLNAYKNCIVAITNPDSFFGSVIPLNAMVELAEVCVNQNHLLIIDEAYIEFNHFEHRQLINQFDNIIIVRSYSKGLGLASMRLGVIMASRSIISYLSRFSSENCISDIALSYLVFLLKNKPRWKKINSEIGSLRDSLTEKIRLRFSRWQVYPSHTNFITIATHSNAEAIKVKNDFLARGIRIRLLDEDETTSHCLRITIPTPEISKILLQIMSRSYESYTSK